MPNSVVKVPIKRLPHAVGILLPTYRTERTAEMDVYAAIDRSITLPPREVRLIPTGFAIAVPVGFEALLRPDSSLAVEHRVGIPNSPATIDADYRGEVLVPLMNLGTDSFTIHRNQRIARILVEPVLRIVWSEVDQLSETQRATGGFGHTGT